MDTRGQTFRGAVNKNSVGGEIGLRGMSRDEILGVYEKEEFEGRRSLKCLN